MMTTTTTTEMLARRGVWTPWAQVLCLACDYAQEDAHKAAGAHVERRPGHVRDPNPAALVSMATEGLGQCNECRATCWVRRDVATIQTIGFALADADWTGPWGWALEQTGGMCAAMVVTTETHKIVTTAMDDEIVVGEYISVTENGNRWMDTLRMAEFALDTAPATVAAAILAWIAERSAP
jgi:hypothetical protein